MSRIETLIDEIHQQVDIHQVITDVLPAATVSGAPRARPIRTFLQEIVSQHLAPGNAGRSLGEVIDAIAVRTPRGSVRVAFPAKMPIVVADRLMERRHAETALVATAGGPRYISHKRVHALQAGLERAFVRAAAPLIRQQLGLTAASSLARGFFLSYAKERDALCKGMACLQCTVNRTHVFSAPPNEIPTCPSCYSPVIRLSSTERCCR